MDYDTFFNKVRSSLPNPLPDERDEKTIVAEIADLHRKGYAVGDVIALCKCFEEVNPDLDEEIALTRMAAIKAKYNA